VVLAHERAGAGRRLPLTDQERGVVAVTGFGEAGLVHMVKGAVDRERGVCQAFHVPLGLGGLGRPAPPALRGRVGDGLQFA
jgi:hypothetical protein